MGMFSDRHFASLLRNVGHIMHAMKDSPCKNCHWVHQVTLEDLNNFVISNCLPSTGSHAHGFALENLLWALVNLVL